jgi:uncharacterized protein
VYKIEISPGTIKCVSEALENLELDVILAFGAGVLLTLLFLNLQPPTLQEEAFDGTREAETYIVAVSNQGEGALGKARVRIAPGDGSLLLNTDPFIETDTQLSARTAKAVAEELTGDDLRAKDVTYSFDIDGSFVGGPSAGAAMTIATISAIEDRTVDEKTAVTGTITREGRIGRVGGILEKAEAAGERGLDKFYVPEGQASITYFERQIVEEEVAPGLFTETVEYMPQKFSVDGYTERRYNMSTEEVSDIEELSEEMIE